MDRFSKGTGIVCEYNPFHKGHAYQIQKLKEMGARFVVCAMSGDFVQRAEPSFQDKITRAENAVKNGADIVLEIPFPFSSMSAEGFAKAGISILENSGLCSSFGFGSECADEEKLSKVAGVLDEDFHKKVLELQKNQPSLAYAPAREKLLCEMLGREYADVVTTPNDILAVEYLKANKSMCPIPVKRETPRGGYDENFASSSYIRKHIFDDETHEFALSHMPKGCNFDGMVKDDNIFFNHVLLSLMQKTPEALSDIAEVSEGSEYSIISAASKAENFEDLCRSLSSKSFTDAKVRRMLLFSFFGVKKSIKSSVPEYTTVLAFSETGRKMLKEYKEDRKIIVASRISDVKSNPVAKEQYDFSRRAFEVLNKCRRMKG